MYVGTLVKTFERDLGPVLQTKTGYTYTREEAQYKPQRWFYTAEEGQTFISASTIPINKLLNSTGIARKSPLADGLIKFASIE